MKHLIIALVALALIIGAIYLINRNDTVMPEGQMPTEENAAAGGIAPAIAWEFESAGEVDGIPQTRVKAFIDGTTHELGVSQGSCAEIAAENLQENQVSGALCWYAGAGDEYAIFVENERYVVKKGVQEEGTAESQGFRGDFETVLSL
jgi:hypothetical protein